MLCEYSVTGVVESSVPTLTAYRIMSDSELNMDVDYDIEDLFCEGDSEVEEDPAPALPADGLESLVCGEGQLFTDSQLVQLVNESPQDPAPKSPTPTPAQSIVELPGTPLHIESWAVEMEEYEKGLLQETKDEEELLESEVEEEQQEQGDHQELLQSASETSDHENEEEVSGDGVEQVSLQSKPSV